MKIVYSLFLAIIPFFIYLAHAQQSEDSTNIIVPTPQPKKPCCYNSTDYHYVPIPADQNFADDTYITCPLGEYISGIYQHGDDAHSKYGPKKIYAIDCYTIKIVCGYADASVNPKVTPYGGKNCV